MGNNEYGGLGLNNIAQYSSPTQIPGTTWNTISLGFYPSGVTGTKTDGTGWAWGYNDEGQLGLNNRTKYSSPTQIPGTTWATITSGSYATFGVKTDGTLWAWGSNSMGRLGLNQAHTLKLSSPVQVGSDTTWSSGDRKCLAGYEGNSGAIKTDGTLWSWGYNQHGELGLNQSNPVKISSPVQVPGTTWSQFRTYKGQCYSIKTDGTWWAWGNNQSGELGQNNTTKYSSPVQVPGTTWSKMSGSHDNAYGIKTDGTLWVWGYNVGGALGLNQPDNTRYSSPVQVPGTTWSDITGGYRSAVAVKTDGTLWSWGYNSMGGLGQNSRTEVSSPIQIGTATDWTSTNLDGEKYGKQSFVISKKV